jgi:hypothetical protein
MSKPEMKTRLIGEWENYLWSLGDDSSFEDFGRLGTPVSGEFVQKCLQYNTECNAK